MAGKHCSGAKSRLSPGTCGKEEWEAEEPRRGPDWGPQSTSGQDPEADWLSCASSHLSLPPVKAAVQLAEGRGQPLLQNVVDHLLRVIAIVLQAGQDEALTKVREEVLHLGDKRVQLHTTHCGTQGSSCPQALWRELSEGGEGEARWVLRQQAPNSTGPGIRRPGSIPGPY